MDTDKKLHKQHMIMTMSEAILFDIEISTTDCAMNKLHDKYLYMYKIVTTILYIVEYKMFALLYFSTHSRPIRQLTKISNRFMLAYRKKKSNFEINFPHPAPHKNR